MAAVEGFAWADDLANLTNNKYGKFMTTVDVHAWQPVLRLQLWGSDEEVSATPHPALEKPGGNPLGAPLSHLRAFFFSFRLGTQTHTRCFKVYEASFPDNKAPFCLPASTAGLCSRLAPAPAFTPSAPALWAVLLPFRGWGLPGSQWEGHYLARTARRLQHYLAHLRRIGATGVLLYADRFSCLALARDPWVRRVLADGTLVVVEWEHIERLQYNADQALVYSHALLGLSACGANLWLQIADVDELLYSPYGSSWPAMYNCLSRTAAAAGGGGDSQAPALFVLQRVNVLASHVSAEAEAALWYSQRTANGSVRHPLDLYDKISKVPMTFAARKYLACPARRLVAVWMHDALPLFGAWHSGNASCAFLLHLPNYWKPRVTDGDAKMNYEPFLPRRTTQPVP